MQKKAHLERASVVSMELRELVQECHARQGGALSKHKHGQLREFCTSLEIDVEEGFTQIEGSLFVIVIIKIHIPDDCDSGVPDDEGDGSFTEWFVLQSAA